MVRETGLYYLQSRYYNPEWGRFINADSSVSTGQGMLSNNMFAYCLNNPVLYYDNTGNAAVLLPSLGDFYLMHKEVQYDIVETYGFAMEVYIRSPLGTGYLDLFDPVNNQYYEVKSIGQASLPNTEVQMLKYDMSHITDLRFLGYWFADSPDRGKSLITGTCQYSYWDIYYVSNGDGLITYTYRVNEYRYQSYIAAVAAVALTIAARSMAGSCSRSGVREGLYVVCMK